MVMWLSAALSAIAFSVATRVRGETERTSTEVDSVRSYYVATGAIERALLWIQWGPGHRGPDGTPLYFNPPMPRMHFEFPAGLADVELIPETSKLDINRVGPDELGRLLLALGVAPERAQTILAGIVDWRSPTPGGSFSAFDQYYLSLTPSFRSRHSSFEEIEELLLIRGMTPDIFHGRYERDAQGALIPHAGLKDCVTVYGGPGPLDVNTVEPAVMEAVGVPPDVAASLVQLRRQMPIRSAQQLLPFTQSPAMGRIGLGSSSFLTLRATASVRLPNGQLSDLRRSVSALVAFVGNEYNPPYHILRWYDNAPSTE